MGLFKKKKEVKEAPALPELPKLPELKTVPASISKKPPELHEELTDEFEESPRIDNYHRLPSFPNNPETDRFSQNTIKHAVQGDRNSPYEEPTNALPENPNIFPTEEDYANYDDSEMETEIPEPPKPKPLKKVIKKEESVPEEKKGPVFIRIDKFEESIKFIKKTKEKISEVEELLSETKQLKEKEEKELIEWEADLKDLKSKIEKIERDLTSKL